MLALFGVLPTSDQRNRPLGVYFLDSQVWPIYCSLLRFDYSLNRNFGMPSAIAERATIATTTHANLSDVARNHLEAHPHFRGRLVDVAIMHEGKTLTLRGQLPSFYLKQLVQEAVRHVPGVQRVRNMIDVVSADGVSSVRC
jgi:hypothetical protein